MPLLTMILIKNNLGKQPCEIFGSVAKQPIILTSYHLQCESLQPVFFLRLPFINNYDSNTNSVIKASIPIIPSFNDIDRAIGGPIATSVNQSTGVITYTTSVQNFEISEGPFCTYRDVNFEFNISRNIPLSFTDYELYASDGTPIQYYQLLLTFTYRRPELI